MYGLGGSQKGWVIKFDIPIEGGFNHLNTGNITYHFVESENIWLRGGDITVLEFLENFKIFKSLGHQSKNENQMPQLPSYSL